MLKMKRENRTVTVNSETENSYYQLVTDSRAFIEFITGFIMSIGFHLKHRDGTAPEQGLKHDFLII